MHKSCDKLLNGSSLKITYTKQNFSRLKRKNFELRKER